jgi:hypothetical protein
LTGEKMKTEAGGFGLDWGRSIYPEEKTGVALIYRDETYAAPLQEKMVRFIAPYALRLLGRGA